MKSKMNPAGMMASRKSEQGAALLTMLLVSILLLSAGLALVTATSLSTTNTIDATAEMQAYAGAEAGLEAALHVLRGNVAPDASISTINMNFRNAAHPATSNKTDDPWAAGATRASRLSGWLNYSYQNVSDADDWRVPVTAAYAPLTGIAFKVLITDPDDPGPMAARKIITDDDYQPSQLIIQSEGYGPKGAIKRLEMIVKRSAFDFVPPGVMTLPGGPGLTFDLGNSASVGYSGVDLGDPPQTSIPVAAVAAGNVAATQLVINNMHDADQVTPNNAGALTADNTPDFLQTADAARAFLSEMRDLAQSSGRLFDDKAAAIAGGGLGTVTDPLFTFIDNYGNDPVDLGSNHQGSGLLIVTGELETNGNTFFEGVIMVLGRGRMERSGGGDGLLRGAFVVAQFDPDDSDDDVIAPPELYINGGGTSTIAFDSTWVRRAMDLSGFRVIGIREFHDPFMPESE